MALRWRRRVAMVEVLARLRAMPAPGAAIAAFGVMAAAQVAYPLASGARAALATVVVVAGATCAVSLAAAAWGAGRALMAAVVVVALTLATEAVGIRTGLPFGHYGYSAILRPQVAGVPVIVPLAWCAMALPARELAARITAQPAARALTGALALTSWDLFLDPQMLREGFWHWSSGGPYRDVPVSNFVGWVLVGTVVVGAVDRLASHAERSEWLVALFVWTWVMETIAFAVFFADLTVALVGGCAMGIPIAAACRGRRR